MPSEDVHTRLIRNIKRSDYSDHLLNSIAWSCVADVVVACHCLHSFLVTTTCSGPAGLANSTVAFYSPWWNPLSSYCLLLWIHPLPDQAAIIAKINSSFSYYECWIRPLPRQTATNVKITTNDYYYRIYSCINIATETPFTFLPQEIYYHKSYYW